MYKLRLQWEAAPHSPQLASHCVCTKPRSGNRSGFCLSPHQRPISCNPFQMCSAHARKFDLFRAKLNSGATHAQLSEENSSSAEAGRRPVHYLARSRHRAKQFVYLKQVSQIQIGLFFCGRDHERRSVKADFIRRCPTYLQLAVSRPLLFAIMANG